MPPSKHAWKTRAELAAELARLEWRAGVRVGFAEGAPGPDASDEAYEGWLRQMRAEYFRTADPELRRAMIELATELRRRDLVAANLERLSAQRAIAVASEGDDARLLALAVAIPLGCVGVGYLLAGIPGEIAGIVVAVLLSGWAFRRHRRSVRSAVAQARDELRRADRGASALESRRVPFDDAEAASGLEDPAFAARSQRVGGAGEPARAPALRLWRAAGGYSAS